ncbi:MAG: PBP1A family penicillin-binding protein [bacterium]
MTKRARVRPKRHHFILTLALFAAGLVLILVGVGAVWIALAPTPDIDSFATREISQSTKIYDRTGTILLYDLNTDTRRDIVSLASTSPYVQKATVAIEDADFYQHSGIRITSIFRAILADLTPGGLTQGGSTITQQVVKKSILTDEKSITRKVHEWILAIKLEQKYSKDQILETYLNEVPYGGSLYGIESASEAYFGTNAGGLSLAESAYLAAIPQAPTYYSPYGSHRASLDARQALVLERMKELGFITDEEYAAAKAEVVTFNPQQPSSIIAPHFVFYIREYLENKYGPQELASGGLKVVTTLDADLEHDAESLVNKYALENVKKFNASNASLVAIDPKTGQILAMVGSRDYFDKDIQGNFNAATSHRQPGSTFKPFVYAAALRKGFTPDTAIFDVPTQFSTSCSPSDIYNDTPPCYAPSDYDDKFRGPMTFTTALAQSINVPAVKTLYLAGIQNVLDVASAMGITSLGDRKQYGLSLALGAGEVSLLELTSAYSAFAADGVRNPPVGILSVTDSAGNTLEEYTPAPEQALDPNVAREMSAMLSNNPARFPEYPPQNPLNIPGYDVAVKTGTTNDYKDAWTVGYTPSIAIGVWAGNNDNSQMVKEIAGYIVAPMWNAVMVKALAKYPKEYFGEPIPPPEISPILQGIWNPEGQVHSELYWLDKDNPQGGAPGNPGNDPQYRYWEYAVQSWFGRSI